VMQLAPGAFRDDRREHEDGDELHENFTEMQGLLCTVGGSIGRLEALGAILRNCVAVMPQSTPLGADLLAASPEKFGQHVSRPSQMTASGGYWQSQEQPEARKGPEPVHVDAHGEAMDGMIHDALKQLYPGAGPAQSSRGGGPKAQNAEQKPRQRAFQQQNHSLSQLQQQQLFSGQAVPQNGAQQHHSAPQRYEQKAMYAPASALSPEFMHHEQQEQQQFIDQRMADVNPEQFLPEGIRLSDIAAQGLPSIGSIWHRDGICKPCVFMYNGICLKGTRCQFCHLSHNAEQVRRVRPSKRTRNLLRQQHDDDDGDDQGESSVHFQVH